MKKLKINAATCDVRKVTEETLSAYDKVEIHTACIVTSPAAQALMGRYAVRVNAAGNLMLDGDVRITTINGPMSIHPGQAVPEEKVYLQVNGPLDIASGCEEILRGYAGMSINGPITCPESVTGLLSGFQINGPVSTYPDGSIVLKRNTVLDRTFHLRARQDALYYAARRVVALAPDIAFEKLAEKNVRFATRQLLVSESLAEAAVPLFDERADIVVLPDGCVYVGDGVKVDENLLKRYGGRLYVAGLVHVTPESAPLLDQITYLRAGDLRVCRSLKDQVLAKGWAFDELCVVGGTVICDRAMAELMGKATGYCKGCWTAPGSSWRRTSRRSSCGRSWWGSPTVPPWSAPPRNSRGSSMPWPRTWPGSAWPVRSPRTSKRMPKRPARTPT